MDTSLASAIRKGALTLVLGAAFFTAATAASAETITTEEPVVLENGESLVAVTEITADAVAAVAGTTIKCRKVHGWHGLKHPLFGYFYWKYILTIRWCWAAGGSKIVKTVNPWSPTYWRDVECCMQFSGWDFKGHTVARHRRWGEQGPVPRPGAGQVPGSASSSASTRRRPGCA